MTGIHKEKTENGIREILFRGKSSTTDEWVYGAFIPDAVESARGMDFPVGYIIWYSDETGHMERETVERGTVGQSTGMLDKNGKKIFEGDLILWPDSFEDGGLEAACEIVWAEGGWAAHEQGFNPDRITQRDMEECEIIGNIHDNPELYQG